jgi:hypothetical protein
MGRKSKSSTPFAAWAIANKHTNKRIAAKLECTEQYVSRLRCAKARPSDLMKARIIVLTKGEVGPECWPE